MTRLSPNPSPNLTPKPSAQPSPEPDKVAPGASENMVALPLDARSVWPKVSIASMEVEALDNFDPEMPVTPLTANGVGSHKTGQKAHSASANETGLEAEGTSRDQNGLEAALAAHTGELRCFLSEWATRQQQILEEGLKRKTVNPAGAEGDPAVTVFAGDSPCRTADTKGVPISVIASAPSDFPAVFDCDSPTRTPNGSAGSPFKVNSTAEIWADSPQTDAEPLRRQSTISTEIKRISSHSNMSPQAVQEQNLPSCIRPVARAYTRWDEACSSKYPCPRLQRFEDGTIFNSMSASVILANAICMAAAADRAIENYKEPESSLLSKLESGFVAIYTLELFFRISVRRLPFFLQFWGWFDVIIVCVGWMEVFSPTASNPTQVRMMRLMKMLKVLRVIKFMRSLREVRLLVFSLASSGKPLLWTVVFGSAINFMFGVCLVQAVGGFRHDNWQMQRQGILPEGDLETELKIEAQAVEHWSSTLWAMYTLFQVSTGGVSWAEVAEPLRLIDYQNFGIFLAYITISIFVMTNAITAIFVASTEEIANKDSTNTIYEQLGRKEEYMRSVFNVYQEMDPDDLGEVSRAKFLENVHDPRMISFANRLEIDSMDLEQFFDVLSARGQRAVDLETFVDGCIKLRGSARSMDIYDLLLHQRSLEKEVAKIVRILESPVAATHYSASV